MSRSAASRVCASVPAARRREPASEVTTGGSGAAAIEALRGIAGRLLISSLQEQAARERAEASDRAKDHFLAMVSHELRAPLQAILGWCALAKLPSAPPDAIEVIERNARAQLALIEDLLDSARINADTLRISPQRSRSRSVSSSRRSRLIRPAAEAKQVSLRLNVHRRSASGHADGDRLRQVMVNVLMNSVKFSPDGRQRRYGSVWQRNGSIEVRVIDHGDGIAADMLPHVFERFWQGDGCGSKSRASRTWPGTEHRPRAGRAARRHHRVSTAAARVRARPAPSPCRGRRLFFRRRFGSPERAVMSPR